MLIAETGYGGAGEAKVTRIEKVVVLLVLTAVLGLLFTLLLRARERWRILAAGLLFGLTAWAPLQYFVLPVLFRLVSEKGFPPLWYAISFGVFGLALGALLAYLPAARSRSNRLLEERPA